MSTPISGIFCPYFPKNGPERGYFLAIRENSGINFLYFSLNGDIGGITTFLVLIFLGGVFLGALLGFHELCHTGIPCLDRGLAFLAFT
ncbi:hypothetical protein DJ90_6071 [Paenibacillus macerans]|uniref:Uncharacterized protein n=1 Tax=Paenibacillus macerans TaxID=44252 RepID=A0A090ZU67_PAEMA|nr:hypothetical protein DJ90_6071 [Paenibacillus macerans]